MQKSHLGAPVGRREFLQHSSLAAGALALPAGAASLMLPNYRKPKTKRVIVALIQEM